MCEFSPRRICFILILWLAPFIAAAQQYRAQANQASNQAQGSLTITCTVVASAELVIGADGEQHLVVANAVAPADKMLTAPKRGGSPEPENASTKTGTWGRESRHKSDR